ncbi:protein FAR-RED IMPAIRED RESPONSE 1-like [Chenopodium quinoa]|uniref:protein FAR-RED IMPAIRED RESPONSE 1-like n=1 Tax=Chenopodium quinoa TaxID=63459 RepID=UPI000B77D9DF|nr:protein FAR-RED IMPAIRED RESPONSE 1-like [Chenopodium quinoa]
MGVCGSGGVVSGKVCDDELNRRKRKSKKCQCGVMLYGSINQEKEWVVRKVVLKHDNHDPIPSQSKLVKEYRMKHLTSRARRNLLNFYDEGVPVSQIHGCVAMERNGLDSMPLTAKYLQHEVYKARGLKMVRGDATAMMAYFQHMQATTNNFYHAQRVDEQGRLKDVFWVDGRSLVAYAGFGDVVCFDATYLTNEYELPFVNFVGVNHHSQSLLLGCALVSHEDCDAFSWIITQWISSMDNRAPLAILTDEAAAMRKPLEEAMLNTRHRWCIWHIMRKIPEKLGKCKRYKEFKSQLKRIVYESFTVEEFESQWCSFIEEYKLLNNEVVDYPVQ